MWCGTDPCISSRQGLLLVFLLGSLPRSLLHPLLLQVQRVHCPRRTVALRAHLNLFLFLWQRDLPERDKDLVRSAGPGLPPGRVRVGRQLVRAPGVPAHRPGEADIHTHAGTHLARHTH